jgi:hypothetical protein
VVALVKGVYGSSMAIGGVSDVVRRKKDCGGRWVDIGGGETFSSELKSIQLPTDP